MNSHLHCRSLLGWCLTGISALLTYGMSFAANASPPHANKSAPNILIAVADDWSYDHAGAYGCRWVKTPAFDRVAQQGILFTNAYTPNAKCAPSRACILTGRNSWQLGAACNHYCFFPPEIKGYTKALAQAGYFVGFTGKGWAPGIALDAEGNARQLTGKPFQARRTKPPTNYISTNNYSANFEEFLDAVPKGKPWCFWYGGYEPHRGYQYGSGARLGGKNPDQIERLPVFWPDNDVVRNDLLDYAFEVEHFDRHLGRILDLLDKREELDNTLVVVTSDNGMPFPRDKGQAYERSNHMPLAIMWRKGIRNPGRRVDDYVSFIDFAPTFLDAAGIDWAATGMLPSPGRNLGSIFISARSGRIDSDRNYVLIGKERHDVGRPHDRGYPIRGIILNHMLYLRNFEPDRWPAGNPETGYLNCGGGPTKTEILALHRMNPRSTYWKLCFGKRTTEELYDLRKDPDCTLNLIGETDYVESLKKLRKRLFDKLMIQNDPRMFGRGNVFEEYPYANESFRGHYERFRQGKANKAKWINPTDIDPVPPTKL